MQVAHCKPIITWDELAAFNLGSPNRQFYRSEYNEQCYAAHKETLTKSGVTVEQYLYSGILCDRDTILERNAFPYYTMHHHFIFWMRPGREIPMDIVLNQVKFKFNLDDNAAIIFENPPELKSVQGVPHYHIFIKLAL